MLADVLADGCPVELPAARDANRCASLGLEDIQRIHREDPAVPLRPRVALVGSAFGGEPGGAEDRVEAHELHRLVGELDRARAGERDAQGEQRVLEAHQPQPDRPMAEIAAFGLRRGVEVDVDHVVEHPHRGLDGVLEEAAIHALGGDVTREVDATQIAHRRLVGGVVERDLGAEVRVVHDAGVVLRAPDIGRVLEGDPRMAGLEEPREHLAPELDRVHDLVPVHPPGRGLALVVLVALLERPSAEFVEVGDLVRREERPRALLLHAPHEQVGYPVRGVHVVRATTLIAGVATQIEEVLDVEVPRLEVGARCAAALAAAVDRDGGVVGDLEERDDALTLDVRAVNVRPGGANRGPVVPDPARPFAHLGVVAYALEDVRQVVVHRGEIAAGELRVREARVKQRGRRRDEAERAEYLVEIERAAGRIVLFQSKAHRDAHPECLRRLDHALPRADEVALVERLDTDVSEHIVAIDVEALSQQAQVEVEEARGELTLFHTQRDTRAEGVSVELPQRLRVGTLVEDLPVEALAVESRRDAVVGGVALHVAGDREE